MRATKTMKPAFFIFCFLSLMFFAVDASLAVDQAEIDKLKKDIEDIKKLVASLSEENAELKKQIADLEAKVTKLENEAKNEQKPNAVMEFIQNIPYLGDAVNYVHNRVAPSEYCSNGCGTKLWDSSDHKQYCRNQGHSGGVHHYYDCQGMYSWFCPRESEHVSTTSTYTCSRCGQSVYEYMRDSHSCR